MNIASLTTVLIAILTTCEGFKNVFLQVPNVTWSNRLQKEAEVWVKYLAKNNKFEHSQKNPGNLYLSSPDKYPDEYCSDAVQWFHWEEKYYNYDKPGYVKKAGHFTQVVWRNSRQIGAAWKIRKDRRLVVSIKYNPGGNYVGYFGKNVFPPTGSTLGPNWPYSPPKFTRCPSPRSAAARKRVCCLYMVVGALVFFYGLI